MVIILFLPTFLLHIQQTMGSMNNTTTPQPVLHYTIIDPTTNISTGFLHSKALVNIKCSHTSNSIRIKSGQILTSQSKISIPIEDLRKLGGVFCSVMDDQIRRDSDLLYSPVQIVPINQSKTCSVEKKCPYCIESLKSPNGSCVALQRRLCAISLVSRTVQPSERTYHCKDEAAIETDTCFHLVGQDTRSAKEASLFCRSKECPLKVTKTSLTSKKSVVEVRGKEQQTTISIDAEAHCSGHCTHFKQVTLEQNLIYVATGENCFLLVPVQSKSKIKHQESQGIVSNMTALFLEEAGHLVRKIKSTVKKATALVIRKPIRRRRSAAMNKPEVKRVAEVKRVRFVRGAANPTTTDEAITTDGATSTGTATTIGEATTTGESETTATTAPTTSTVPDTTTTLLTTTPAPATTIIPLKWSNSLCNTIGSTYECLSVNSTSCNNDRSCNSGICELSFPMDVSGTIKKGMCREKRLHEMCDKNSECESNKCADNLLCMKGCINHGDCATSMKCTEKACRGQLKTLQTCTKKQECQNGICIDGKCRGWCTVDDDCDTGFYCNAKNCEKKKKTRSKCTKSGECDSGTCTGGICRSSTTAGKAAGEACKTSVECKGLCMFGICRELCVSGSCGSDFTCHGNACVGNKKLNESCIKHEECETYTCDTLDNLCAVRCDDEKCPSQYSCNTVAGFKTCQMIKRSDGETCIEDRQCTSNRCLPNTGPGVCRSTSPPTSTLGKPCTNSKECADDQLCSSGFCRTYCQDDAMCSSTTFDKCQGGVCLPKIPNNSPCLFNWQCKEEHCAHGFCRSSADVNAGATAVNVGKSCNTNVDCHAVKQICRSGICLDYCARNTDCPLTGDQECKENACVGKMKLGKMCSSNHECESYLCSDVCVVSCSTSSSCPTNHRCSNNKCVYVSKDNGERCSNGIECTSRTCHSGICRTSSAGLLSPGKPCTKTEECDGLCRVGVCRKFCRDASNCRASTEICKDSACIGMKAMKATCKLHSQCASFACGNTGKCASRCVISGDCAKDYRCELTPDDTKPSPMNVNTCEYTRDNCKADQFCKFDTADDSCDCLDLKRCSSASCTDAHCDTTTRFGSSGICRKRQFYEPCARHVDCESGFCKDSLFCASTCDSSTCKKKILEKCTKHEDCKKGYCVVSGADKRCIYACTGHADCHADYFCVTNSHCEKRRVIGDVCTTGQCQPLLTCNHNICKQSSGLKGDGKHCVTNSDCTNMCWGGICRSDCTSCSGTNRKCEDNICIGKLQFGKACTDNSECESYACNSGQCTAICSTTENCPYGYVCDMLKKQCRSSTVNTKGLGETCSETRECAFGKCLVGKCERECNSTWTCPLPYQCNNDICSGTQPLYGYCDHNTDCKSLNCEVNKHTCVDTSTPTGSAVAGDPCTKDTDCKSGVCEYDGITATQKTCLYKCDNHTNCHKTKQFCTVRNGCKTGWTYPFGTECEVDFDCMSGSCALIYGFRVCSDACPCSAYSTTQVQCVGTDCVGKGEEFAYCDENSDCQSLRCKTSHNICVKENPASINGVSVGDQCAVKGDCETRLCEYPSPKQLNKTCLQRCETDANCGSNGFCSSSQGCKNGTRYQTGEQCVDDGDCSGNKCHSISGFDVCTKECSSTTECPFGLVCNETICRGHAQDREYCQQNADCDSLRCDPVRRICVDQDPASIIGVPAGDACTAATNCSSRLCERLAHSEERKSISSDTVCLNPCFNDSNCDPNQFCSSRRCKKGPRYLIGLPCVRNDDCLTRECKKFGTDQKLCTKACLPNNKCSPTNGLILKCDSSDKLCKGVRADDDYCTSNAQCKSLMCDHKVKMCVSDNRIETAGRKTGDPCTSDANCQSKRCASRKCVSRCNSQNECPDTSKHCNMSSTACEDRVNTDKACDTDEGCLAGNKCQSGYCAPICTPGSCGTGVCKQSVCVGTKKMFDYCTQHADCESRTCDIQHNVCTARCYHQCNCQGNLCRGTKDKGNSCSHNSECKSGLCGDAKCRERCATDSTTQYCNGSGFYDKKAEKLGCDEDKECKPGSICALNRCAKDCTSSRSTACISPEVCTTTGTGVKKVCTGSREVGELCNKDFECSTLRCNANRCRKPCTGDSECQPSGECKHKSCIGGKRIGASCKTSADCSNGKCYNSRCTEVCLSQNQCSPTQACSPAGLCVGTISENKMCKHNESCKSLQCFNNVCRKHCSQSSDCSTTWVSTTSDNYKCRTSDNICIGDTLSLNALPARARKRAAAATESECAVPWGCKSGYCGQIESKKYCLKRCLSHDDCTNDKLYCDLTANACFPKKENMKQCINDVECRGGACQNQVCTNTCPAGNCDSAKAPSKCGSSKKCIGESKAGQYCSDHRFCDSLVCGKNVCRRFCANNDTCPGGFECSERFCQHKNKKGNLGATCDRNADCSSGKCYMRKCRDICRAMSCSDSELSCNQENILDNDKADTKCEQNSDCFSQKCFNNICIRTINNTRSKRQSSGNQCSNECSTFGFSSCSKIPAIGAETYCSGKTNTGELCLKSTDCTELACSVSALFGVCRTACKTNADCPNSNKEVCINNGCRGKADVGAKCVTSNECDSGLCELGSCVRRCNGEVAGCGKKGHWTCSVPKSACMAQDPETADEPSNTSFHVAIAFLVILLVGAIIAIALLVYRHKNEKKAQPERKESKTKDEKPKKKPKDDSGAATTTATAIPEKKLDTPKEELKLPEPVKVAEPPPPVKTEPEKEIEDKRVYVGIKNVQKEIEEEELTDAMKQFDQAFRDSVNALMPHYTEKIPQLKEAAAKQKIVELTNKETKETPKDGVELQTDDLSASTQQSQNETDKEAKEESGKKEASVEQNKTEPTDESTAKSDKGKEKKKPKKDKKETDKKESSRKKKERSSSSKRKSKKEE